MNSDHKQEIISLFYHNKLSILLINRQFNRMFTEKEIARVIIESEMTIENEFIVLESTMNYTNRIAKKEKL